MTETRQRISKRERFVREFYDKGAVACEACGRIDLAAAGNAEEAIEIWNEHVIETHLGGEDPRQSPDTGANDTGGEANA